jgi:hypothetical protein
MVFRRFEDVEWDTQDFTCFFVDGVEEIKKNLLVLVT